MRKVLIIGFFLLLIFSPIYGWIFANRSELREKRTLAKMPEFSIRRLIDGNFYRELGKFHDDSFPYRSWIIKAKNLIDYKLFHTSPSSKVHLGKDDWLFLTVRLKEYYKDSCEHREKIRRLAKQLSELELELEASGQRLIFLIGHIKSTIYPEFVGLERYDNGCNMSQYDLLLDAFKEFPVKGFLKLDDLLREGKKANRIYHKTDTHWNYYGIMIVTKALLEKLSPSREDLLPQVKTSLKKKKRDIAGLMSMHVVDLREEYDEIVEIVDVSEVKGEKKTLLENKRPRFSFSATPKSGERLLPKTIVYRDSYFRYPLELLKGSFEQVDALWTARVPSKEGFELEELKAAKIVIIEVVESSIKGVNLDGILKQKRMEREQREQRAILQGESS